MKSVRRGKSISSKSATVEISHISSTGLWILINEEEVYLSFKNFPWFKDAKLREIYTFKATSSAHLHWPDLDVDLYIETIKRPDRFPLILK